jgi:hypothetical protein
MTIFKLKNTAVVQMESLFGRDARFKSDSWMEIKMT